MNFRPVLAGALALIATPAFSCDHLTRHFEICTGGTPWEDGRWESAGDSDTLWLGDIGYVSFEDYLGRDSARSIEAERETLLAEWQDSIAALHAEDAFETGDLRVVRLITSRAWPDGPAFIEATMIAEAGDRPGQRLMMRVTAPAGTPPADLDALSRGYAGLIRPVESLEGN